MREESQIVELERSGDIELFRFLKRATSGRKGNAPFDAAISACQLLAIELDSSETPTEFAIDSKSAKPVNCPVTKKLAPFGRILRAQGVVACGVHVVDPTVGRRSRVWVNGDWLRQSAPDQMKKVLSDPGLNIRWLGEVFSHVWVRVFWQVLRSNTTIVNAFSDKVLNWDGNPMYVNWDANDEHASDKSGNIVFDEAFVKGTSTIAQEFTNTVWEVLADEYFQSESVLSKEFESNWNNLPRHEAKEKYKIRIKLIENRAVGILRNLKIAERLQLLTDDCRIRIYNDDESKLRLRFITTMRDLEVHERLCGAEAKKRTYYDSALWKNGNVLKSGLDRAFATQLAWDSIGACLEAVQSIVMNQFAFCGTSGLWIDRTELRDDAGSFVYIFLGFKSTPDTKALRPTLTTLEHVIDSLFKKAYSLRERDSEMMEPAQNVVFNTIRPILLENDKKSLKKDKRPRYADENTVEPLNLIESEHSLHNTFVDSNGFRNWISIVQMLASASIHEQRDLRFILGIGPSHLPQVKGRLFEEPPSKFKSNTALNAQVVHFLKSYYSLFGENSRRVVWFDKKGVFQGVYESPSSIDDISWLESWGTNSSANSASKNDGGSLYYVAHIKGLDAFDLMRGDLQPLVRFRNGTVSTPSGSVSIEKAIHRGCQLLQLGRKNENRSKTLQGSVASIAVKLTEFLQRSGSGASFLIANMLECPNGTVFRTPLANQRKSLVANLARYKYPIAGIEEVLKLNNEDAGALTASSKRILERIVGHMIPLANLDGALIVEIRKEGLAVLPAQQLLPLYTNSDKPGTMFPLDFFRLADGDLPDKVQDDYSSIFCERRLAKGRRLMNLDEVRKLVRSVNSAGGRGTRQRGHWLDNLIFLNSTGTRHHSVWGISLTASENLFGVTISKDGQVHVFWDGLDLVQESVDKTK